MAGLGRRTFAPGEVLTSSNVMNFLMDQSVMNFADDGARGSAIGTAVSEGMVSYLADTDSLEVYRAIGTASPGWDAVAFADNVPTLNGVGLIPVVPSSVVIATGSGSANDLGVVSFSGATSVSLNDVFTSTYKNYVLILNIDSTSGSVTTRLRLRNSGTDITSANYYGTGTYSLNSTTALSFTNENAQTSGIAFGVSTSGHAIFNFFAPQITSGRKQINLSYTSLVGDMRNGSQSILYLASQNYNSITLFAASNNFTGTAQIFGYNE